MKLLDGNAALCIFVFSTSKHFAGHFHTKVFYFHMVSNVKMCVNGYTRKSPRLYGFTRMYTHSNYEAMASWKPQTSSSETWKVSAHSGGLSKVVQLPVRPWLSSESM